MECPFIDKRPPDPKFNKPINYRELGGEDYIFYDHDDGFGETAWVQFCLKIGRKKDIFQCFNESEWKVCPYYRIQRNMIERAQEGHRDGKA